MWRLVNALYLDTFEGVCVALLIAGIVIALIIKVAHNHVFTL
jgi:hypothetical protein